MHGQFSEIRSSRDHIAIENCKGNHPEPIYLDGTLWKALCISILFNQYQQSQEAQEHGMDYNHSLFF